MAETRLVPCLGDNYAVLVHDAPSGDTLLVDVPEADAVLAVLRETGWRLVGILLTHHHADHVGGLAAVKAATGAEAVGPAGEAGRIDGLDRTVADGDGVSIGAFRAVAIETPGHTAAPISWHLPDERLAFTGDTLFAMGCGRLFEGDAATMWRSLVRLRERLPDETEIFCGHEYTLKNAEYAESLGIDIPPLRERIDKVKRMRAAGEPTLPTTMALEKATNPFMLADDARVAGAVGLSGRGPEEVFARLRKGRDGF